MSTIDPKDDGRKPAEAQEKKAGAVPEKEVPHISLGDIVPLSKDALQQISVRRTAQTDGLLNFGASSISSKDADNRFIGRGLTPGLKAEQSPENRNNMLKAQHAQQEQSSREFRWVQSNASPGMQFAGGNRQSFRYLKGEEIKPPVDIKPMAELKPLSDKFLTETQPRKDSKLTAAEQRDLEQSRQQLVEATDPGDVLSKAIHLARLYQHLRYIEEAKKALQLALGIDPDNPQVRQLFKELERMHPVDVGITSHAISQASLTKSILRKRIMSLSSGRVIVAGDLLIDELLEGKPERISREAPVLILEHVDTVLIPGGAANTAHNIAALGGTCHAIGVAGDDEYADKMAELLTSCGITHSLVRDKSRPTTVKTRILSKSHSLMQQLLRLDRISHDPISTEIEFALVQRLEQCASSYKAIVLSDYKAGVITDGIIESCRKLAARQDIMVIVDAQQRFERFKGVTLMTPNQPDTEKAVGYKITSRETLIKAGKDILASTGARALLLTRGADGMVLFEQNQDMIELPAFNRTDVFDVTGAGDTVVGTMALALVTGSNFMEAMALGNLAAGIVVRKSGTAVTSQREMLDTLELLNLPD